MDVPTSHASATKHTSEPHRRTRPLSRWVVAAFAAAAAALSVVAPAHAEPDPPITPQIIGGSNATEAYDFMLSLQVEFQGSNYHVCGAVLIKPGWAVTAAHCSAYYGLYPYRIAAGSHQLSVTVDTSPVAEFIIHPGYDGDHEGTFHDIALLRLATPSTHTPITIAKKAGKHGTPTRLLGWGRAADGYPDYLQQLDTTIKKAQDCTPELLLDKHTEICVQPPPLTGPCDGDSGGPLLQARPQGWELIGVASRAESACNHFESIYTDVTAYKGWITGYTG